MYPTEDDPNAKIVYQTPELPCDHHWLVGYGSYYGPVCYCGKCKIQKPLIPDDIFKKLMEANHG